jgi:CDP-diacylglycerol--glycerol-3-phosphate 3-phosphatidyltransferase
MFFTIPTLLTWARIVAIPLIVGVFYLPVEPATRNLVATVLFVVVALTDWLDGYLARRLNQSSAFGAFLDPVADKFLVCASLLILVQMDRVNALIALVIIGREIAISALREWMAQIGASRSVAVHMIGKLKTTVQMIAIPSCCSTAAVRRGVHPPVGHGAHPGGGGADHLVHGVLPAQGPARDPRQGALSHGPA